MAGEPTRDKAVRCPTCRSEPGRACRNKWRSYASSHVKRKEAYTSHLERQLAERDARIAELEHQLAGERHARGMERALARERKERES